jgi:hypothetical protein
MDEELLYLLAGQIEKTIPHPDSEHLKGGQP